MSPSTGHWSKLGELLTLRRVELDPRYQNRTVFCEERGLDYRLAYDIEEARRVNFRKTTLAGVAAAYAVTLDSLLAVLEGKAAGLEPAPGRPREAAAPRPDIMHASSPEEEFIAAILPLLRPEDQEVVKGIRRLVDEEGRPWPWERQRALIESWVTQHRQRQPEAGLRPCLAP